MRTSCRARCTRSGEAAETRPQIKEACLVDHEVEEVVLDRQFCGRMVAEEVLRVVEARRIIIHAKEESDPGPGMKPGGGP